MYFTILHVVSSGRCYALLPSYIYSALVWQIKQPRFDAWPEHCVGQDTFLSQCLSTLLQLYRLASHPGGSGSTPNRFMSKNQDKAPSWSGPLGSYAEFTFTWSVVIIDFVTLNWVWKIFSGSAIWPNQWRIPPLILGKKRNDWRENGRQGK